ncbi:unnamed protein product [Vitrella brassicaformis CCMP3155]|uniref:Uncharacterized protein n=1 Tax=Vitrella brassicaformis (strain CCMP3155) TaxID=1169540 RepID=A0A0G4EJU4_VITBC|nr:unnamed protein product [Vitrella brassicaformis CCMP3155]|eukprot:CEL96812.1 unnamed protein product [Vitrella brassicaformis CCMP3155]
MELERLGGLPGGAHGFDMMGGTLIFPYRPLQKILLVRLLGPVDANDPPCRYRRVDYGSFSGMIIERMSTERACLMHGKTWGRQTAQFDQIASMMNEPPPLYRRDKVTVNEQEIRCDLVTQKMIDQCDPVTRDTINFVKNGCRTIDYVIGDDTSCRLLILCGDKEGDGCAAHISVHMNRPMEGDERSWAYIAAWSTEEPQGDGSRPTDFHLAFSKLCALPALK